MKAGRYRRGKGPIRRLCGFIIHGDVVSALCQSGGEHRLRQLWIAPYGGGDWNDGMDDVGRDGGESVWLGWFLLDVLDKCAA